MFRQLQSITTKFNMLRSRTSVRLNSVVREVHHAVKTKNKPSSKLSYSTKYTAHSPDSRWNTRSQVRARGFHITTTTMDDRPKILSLLRSTFLRDEPLLLAAGLGSASSKELEDHLLVCLNENISMVALSFKGDLLGVSLNATCSPPGDPNERLEEIRLCKCPKTCKVYKFWEYIERQANLWNLYAASHLFEVRILATSTEERGKGISKALTDSSMELARVMNYPLVRIDCTSHYSALIAEKLGFDCVYTLDYKDYRGDDGKPVFRPNPPHYSAKIYALGLNTAVCC